MERTSKGMRNARIALRAFSPPPPTFRACEEFVWRYAGACNVIMRVCVREVFGEGLCGRLNIFNCNGSEMYV